MSCPRERQQVPADLQLGLTHAGVAELVLMQKISDLHCHLQFKAHFQVPPFITGFQPITGLVILKCVCGLVSALSLVSQSLALLASVVLTHEKMPLFPHGAHRTQLGE